MQRLTPAAWDAAVRARLRTARQARGLSFAATRPRYGAARLELQGGTLRLDTVLRLCKSYKVRPDLILDGWPGADRPIGPSDPPPIASPAELEKLRSVKSVVTRVREELLARRHALGVGTPTVALNVWGSQSSSAMLLRLESGKTKRPDALQVYMLSLYYDCSFADLLGYTTPEVPCQEPNPPPPWP